MATPKKRIKKRKVGTLNMLTGEYTPVKKKKATLADAREIRRSIDWDTLEELCQQLADAQEADSWKGGGDPEYIPVVEAELELAKLKLRTHIDTMRKRYEETQ